MRRRDGVVGGHLPHQAAWAGVGSFLIAFRLARPKPARLMKGEKMDEEARKPFMVWTGPGKQLRFDPNEWEFVGEKHTQRGWSPLDGHAEWFIREELYSTVREGKTLWVNIRWEDHCDVAVSRDPEDPECALISDEDAAQWLAETDIAFPPALSELKSSTTISPENIEEVFLADESPPSREEPTEEADKLPTPYNQNPNRPDEESEPPKPTDVFECCVTLLQMASIVSKSKRTLERLRDNGELPTPTVKGGEGKADEWLWSDVRPILQEEYRRKLPEVFPSDRFIR